MTVTCLRTVAMFKHKQGHAPSIINKHCGRGGSLMSDTCLRTVAMCKHKQGHASSITNKHCGGGGSLMTDTCLRTVGTCKHKQGHATCKVLSLQEIIFLCQLNTHGDY